MAIHICNDTVECIIRIIDFLWKVKHVRPTAEKIYTPIKKGLNDELDIPKNKTNIDYLINNDVEEVRGEGEQESVFIVERKKENLEE